MTTKGPGDGGVQKAGHAAATVKHDTQIERHRAQSLGVAMAPTLDLGLYIFKVVTVVCESPPVYDGIILAGMNSVANVGGSETNIALYGVQEMAETASLGPGSKVFVLNHPVKGPWVISGAGGASSGTGYFLNVYDSGGTT